VAALPPLELELERGLKEVDVQARRPAQFGELAVGALAREAVIAHELPHHGAILLLDVALVVLPVRPPARE